MSRASSPFGQVAGLLMVGVGVGWLMGLSVSPVLHLVVGALVTLAGALVGALAGLQTEQTAVPPAANPSVTSPIASDTPDPPLPTVDTQSGSALSTLERTKVSSLPLAIIMIGIVLGSAGGLFARTNEVFGVNPSYQARRWSNTGIGSEKLARNLWLNHLLGSTDPGAHSTDVGKLRQEISYTVPGLLNMDATEKEKLLSLPGPALHDVLEHRFGDQIPGVLQYTDGKVCDSEKCLKAIVKELL